MLRSWSPARQAVLGAFVALGFAAGNWGSRVPDVKSDLDLSEGALGAALLMLALGAVSGSWLGSLLVRRYGFRLVVRTAWIVLGGALVLPGLVATMSALAAALFVFGLAIGVLDVSMNGAGVVLEAAARRPLMNGLHAGWSAGVLMGAAMGVAAVVADIPTDMHLAGAGLIIVVTGASFGGRVPDGQIGIDTSEHDDLDTRVAEQTSRRRLAALAAIGGFVFLAEGALLDWAGVLVRETLGGGEILGVLAVIGVAAGGLLGRLSGDRLTERVGAASLIRSGSIVAAAVLGAVLLSPIAWPAPILIVIVGAGIAPAVPLAFAAAGRLYGAAGISIVTTAGYGCYLVGPAAIGWLADHVGLQAALVLPLTLVVGIAFLAWSTADSSELGDNAPHPEPV